MSTLVVWALAWALAIIASAIVFKGNPIGDWVEAFLILGALTFWYWHWWRQCGRVR
jgi:hypothetical protein